MESKANSTSNVDQTVAQFIDAGIGLVMLPFSMAQQSFEKSKKTTGEKFDELQARGSKLEADLREKIEPAKNRIKVSAMCNQVVKMLSPKASREAKLDALSKKIDTLVELVATIAAKQAAAAKEGSEGKKETPAPAAKTRRRSTTAAASSATAAKPATRKRATTTKRTTKPKAPAAKAAEGNKDA